jgi:hypothetical protein
MVLLCKNSGGSGQHDKLPCEGNLISTLTLSLSLVWGNTSLRLLKAASYYAHSSTSVGHAPIGILTAFSYGQ